MMNIALVLLAKGALFDIVEGMNSNDFSLAPFTYSKPLSFLEDNVIDL